MIDVAANRYQYRSKQSQHDHRSSCNDNLYFLWIMLLLQALTLCGVLLFLYGFLSCLAPSFGWLLLLRGLVGFAIGCVPQSVTLYAEFLPTKQRAKCVVLLDVSLMAPEYVYLCMLILKLRFFSVFGHLAPASKLHSH